MGKECWFLTHGISLGLFVCLFFHKKATPVQADSFLHTSGFENMVAIVTNVPTSFDDLKF